jgi:hypothetical protein
MPRIAEADFFVLRARVGNQYVLIFKIDRLAFIENSPDSFRAQNLLALVVAFVDVL